MESKTTWVWVLAHVNRDNIDIMERDLLSFNHFLACGGLSNHTKNVKVEGYIPMVKFLKKNFKGKEVFENIPLLFNYGFFRVPKSLSRDPEFLNTLKKHVNCLHSWVSDPASIHFKYPKSPKRPRKEKVRKTKKKSESVVEPEISTELKKLKKGGPVCAIISDKEIRRIEEVSLRNSIFNDLDIDKLQPGMLITLRGYPFDGIPAEIVTIHRKLEKVTVKLLLSRIMTEVKVSFANIFYTVYSDYDETREVANLSLDDNNLTAVKRIDKIYANLDYNTESHES